VHTQNGKFTRVELIRFFVCIAVVAFLLNWIWEMSQMPAYREMAARSVLETAGRCALAAFGDVVITFWIYAVGALAAHSLSWGLRARWNVFVAVALLGAMHAFWIEQAGIASGHWTYTNAMPIIPRLGVGLWPFLQLPVLTPLTVALSSRFALAKRSRVVHRVPSRRTP